jgi:hypothetical protein
MELSNRGIKEEELALSVYIISYYISIAIRLCYITLLYIAMK